MHQPELRRIQTQYRDDRQKMNEELMKFYAGAQDQPGRRLPAAADPAPGLHHPLQRHPGPDPAHLACSRPCSRGDPGLAGTFDPKYIDHSSRALRRPARRPRDGVLRASTCPARRCRPWATGSARPGPTCCWSSASPSPATAAEPDPGPQHRPDQPADADDHPDHADHLRGLLAELPRRPGRVLVHLGPLAHRPAVHHRQAHLHRRGQAPARGRQGPGRDHHHHGEGRCRRRRAPAPQRRVLQPPAGRHAASRTAPTAPTAPAGTATPSPVPTRQSTATPANDRRRPGPPGESPHRAAAQPRPASGRSGSSHGVGRDHRQDRRRGP